MKLLEEEEKERLLLWKEGLTDREIAEKVGKSVFTIRHWRQKLGLPSNANTRQLTEEEEEERFLLWEMGMNDREIGEIVGRKPDAISRWRKSRGLPANHKYPTRRRKYDRLFSKLYEQGYSDQEIAERVSCHHFTVYSWRKRKNLPSQRRRKHIERDIGRKKDVESGLDLFQLSEKWQITPDAVYSYLKSHKLLSEDLMQDYSEFLHAYRYGREVERLVNKLHERDKNNPNSLFYDKKCVLDFIRGVREEE